MEEKDKGNGNKVKGTVLTLVRLAVYEHCEIISGQRDELIE